MWVIFWQTALIGIEKIKVLVCRRMGDGYQRCSSSHEIVLDGKGLYNEAWKPYRDLILKSRHATASKIIASINELPIIISRSEQHYIIIYYITHNIQ